MKKTILFTLFMTILSVNSQTTHTVNAGSFYYTPSQLTITQGDIVEWVNDGGFHDVNGDINSITGTSFGNPESFSSSPTNTVGAIIYAHQFDISGEYLYDCSVGSHAQAGMVGSITVLPSSNTVADIVINSGDHNTLEAAVVAAGLVETLSSTGPFTLFAPTDDAFDLLPEGTLESLLAEPSGLLTDILLGHVVSGETLSTELSNGMMIETLNGNELSVSIDDTGVMINNAMVTVADIIADNGVVHVINAVLVPETECSNDDATIESFFGNFAVISCDSLIEYLSSNYDYTLTMSCNWNGVPMIDLGQSIAEICECSCEDVDDVPEESYTIVDIIVNSDDHNTLEAAVIEANLATTLSGDGPFTVFAPTDAAFDALPAGTVETLLQDPSGQLTNILLHHVVSGETLSTDLSDGMMIETLNESNVNVTIQSDMVMIDNAVVTFADLIADNGVVHVIDAVLIPSENSNITENTYNDNIILTVDLNGKIVSKSVKNTILLDIYESGKIYKRIRK